MNNVEEVWRPVAGYNGRYEVSDLGNVKSMDYNHTGQTRVLSECDDGSGYRLVCLCKDGRQKSCKVHRLVAEAFIPNPGNLPQVNHKNEDKTDNRAENLEWCSQSYNINYGTANERAGKAKVNHPGLSRTVFQFDLQGHLVREWPSLHEVRRQTGWNCANISACCLGKCKTAYHHFWKYEI